MVEKGMSLSTGMVGRVGEDAGVTLVEPAERTGGEQTKKRGTTISAGSLLASVAPAVVVAVYLVALVAVELGVGSNSLWMAFLAVFTLTVVGAIVHRERGGLR